MHIDKKNLILGLIILLTKKHFTLFKFPIEEVFLIEGVLNSFGILKDLIVAVQELLLDGLFLWLVWLDFLLRIPSREKQLLSGMQ
jgi:hypothetical protein